MTGNGRKMLVFLKQNLLEPYYFIPKDYDVGGTESMEISLCWKEVL